MDVLNRNKNIDNIRYNFYRFNMAHYLLLQSRGIIIIIVCILTRCETIP